MHISKFNVVLVRFGNVYATNVALIVYSLSQTPPGLYDLPGYNHFYHSYSSTAAGGAGIYVCENLKCIPRPDLTLSIEDVESCWVEIDLKSLRIRW